jgi:cholest-4-en-3-one 26-monooxygenase
MSAPATSTPELDLVHPATYVEHGYPHDIWTRLRREAPVSWVERPDGDSFWAITKHADITHIGKNPEIFLNGPSLFVEFEGRNEEEPRFEAPPTLISLDPPIHHKYRQLINKRFTPRAMRGMHGDIERIANRIVDDLFEEGDEGTVDFVEKIAAPLPIAVIAWLLGVPESDWNLLFEWTNRTIGAGDPEYQKEGESSAETANAAMIELFTYFTKMVEEKRKNPADDLVTLFAHAEVDGKKLEPMDVLSWCFIIVVAGNETTRNATSGGMLALIEHQDQLRRVQQDPGLLKSAVEEILRWTSPIIHFGRTASRDTEVRGQKIREGERLGLFYGSANRDEEIFERPFEFDVGRKPNRHLAFGVGEHFCAGAHVARLELEVAYRHLLPRIEEIELAGPPERLYSALVGGVKHLPIRYKLRPA